MRRLPLFNLKRTLGTDLKRKAGPRDTVIIYYAGHGAPETDAMSPDGDGLEKYLIPHDADPQDLYATGLPMREKSKPSFVAFRLKGSFLSPILAIVEPRQAGHSLPPPVEPPSPTSSWPGWPKERGGWF